MVIARFYENIASFNLLDNDKHFCILSDIKIHSQGVFNVQEYRDCLNITYT